MTPRAILAALLASCIISAIMVYLTAKKWEPEYRDNPDLVEFLRVNLK